MPLEMVSRSTIGILLIAPLIFSAGMGPTTAQEEGVTTEAALGSDRGDATDLDRLPAYSEDFARLKARAQELSRARTPDFDPDIYYATLRRGLPLVGRRRDGDGRSGGPQPQVDFEAFPSAEPIMGVDDDPAERARIDRMLKDGLSREPRLRIVGGEPAKVGQFTETVAIVSDLVDGYCSGTVIAHGKILTAAHCVCAMKLRKSEPGEAYVYFGNPKARGPGFAAPKAKIINDQTVLMNDNFCKMWRQRRICGEDLAVVGFSGAKTPPYVTLARPAHWQEAAGLFEQYTALIAGYGATRDQDRRRPEPNGTIGGGTRPKSFASIPLPRRCAEVERLCNPSGQKWGCRAHQEIILEDSGKDSCTGDSGGPVFLPDSDFRSEKILVAVTSRGLDVTEKCGLGGIYTSVYSHPARKFLKEKAGVLE